MANDTNTPNPEACLKPTQFIDSDAPAIRDLILAMELEGCSIRERAVRIFEHVRDNVTYEFMIRFTPEEYQASYTLGDGRGFCVRKSILLCALARAAGVPAALVLSDLRDLSLSTRVTLALGTDIMYHHGLTAFHIDGNWLKVDASLSPDIVTKKRYRPVKFDGVSDALQQSTTLDGSPHAQYLEIHGLYEDLPYDQMMEAFGLGYKDADMAMFAKLGLQQ